MICKFMWGFLLLIIVVSWPIAADQVEDDLNAKIAALMPKEGDFVFKAPMDWGDNLMKSARIIALDEGEDAAEAEKIRDGNPWTVWQSKRHDPAPVVLCDLGSTRAFNRLLVFNRHSEARGTGWGNNAVREIEVQVKTGDDEGEFCSMGVFPLIGPKGTCVEKQGGRICFFVDSTKPNQIELPPTRARFVRFILKASFWDKDMPDQYRTSMALSELMLFQVNKRDH